MGNSGKEHKEQSQWLYSNRMMRVITPKEEKKPTSRNEWTAVLAGLVAIVAILVVLIILFYQLSLVCPERTAYPTFDMTISATPEGYEIEFTVVSELHSLDSYKVNVVKDGKRWGGFPTPMEHGSLGRGPAGEYLNFTDLTLDGNLTTYDWFTLENLESSSEYELVLSWAECSKRLKTATISVP